MIDYQIKAINKDFRVTEIVDLDLSGGAHSVYFLNKSGMKTADAVEQISRMLNIPVSVISYSGLKDEDAITGQFISIPDVNFEKLFFTGENESYFTLKHIGNSPTSFVIGKLFGNAFCIRIRRLDIDIAQKIVASKKKMINIINYYGIQRFGMPGLPKITHYIGKALLEGKLEEMAELLFRSGNISAEEYSYYQSAPQSILNHIDIRKLNFFLNAWDSHVWNQLVADNLMINAGDSEKREISGVSYLYTHVNTNIIENLSKLPITRHKLTSEFMKEEYISYRQPVLPLVYSCSEIMDDEINIGKVMIDLKFTLPSGAYATVAIDQMIWQFSH